MTSAIRAIFSQTTMVFLVLLFGSTAWAKEISGRVVAIADGDTATVLVAGNRQVRVRLAAIDATERAQPFGNRSKQALQYSAAEDIARQKKRGLWVDEAPTPPWEWRRRK